MDTAPAAPDVKPSAYADFNAWLATNPDPATLKPTAAQINEVFSHTTICSDLCATASNGVCDASCLHGSDCSDCGSAPKPAAFPITLRRTTTLCKRSSEFSSAADCLPSQTSWRWPRRQPAGPL